MKLTKKHIKQIIKEELSAMLGESWFGSDDEHDDALFGAATKSAIRRGANPAGQELKDRIAAHRGDEPKRARSGQEVADELESGPSGSERYRRALVDRDPWDGIEANNEMISDNALKIEYLARAAGVEIPIDLSSPRGPKG